MTHINIRSKEEHRTVLPFLSPLAEERAWASFLFFSSFSSFFSKKNKQEGEKSGKQKTFTEERWFVLVCVCWFSALHPSDLGFQAGGVHRKTK